MKTVADLATDLQLSERTVRRWIASGKLPAIHLGRRVRVDEREYRRFLRAHAGKSSGDGSV